MSNDNNEKSLTKVTPAKQDKKNTAKPVKKEKTKGKVAKFIKDLKAEVKKVVWPSKKQVINNTGIVLVTMGAAGVFVWGLDTVLSQILKLFLGV